MHTARTSITINSGLLSRLKLFSKMESKSVSQIIEEAVEEKLAKQRDQKVQKVYEQAWELRDSLKDGTQDLRYENMSHDELLYGEKGAWSTNNMADDDE